MQNEFWNFQYSYRSLPADFYSDVVPAKLRHPSFVVFNDILAESLGIDVSEVAKSNHLSLFSGQVQVDSFSQAYAGHQYGNFVQLGDGRAVVLGEHTAPDGRLWDIQLKGSGQTPYSRRGDGKAALGPMLREYLVSEFMSAANIPTTRSLAVILTGERVQRAKAVPGATLVRVAEGHLRVGTFEFAAHMSGAENLKKLLEYTIHRHFPKLLESSTSAKDFFLEVVDRQARLIAKWMSIGFVHGVMNTDNMSIVGETIDYGPCAFLDDYEPAQTFSSIDHYGRYSYSNQPNIGLWNLERFADTLQSILTKEELIDGLDSYKEKFRSYWLSGMLEKIGFTSTDQTRTQSLNDLLVMMSKYKLDYTQTFSELTRGVHSESPLFGNEGFAAWNKNWSSLNPNRDLMMKVNPLIIPRNHQVEKAIRAAEDFGDFSAFSNLLGAIGKPFTSTHLEYAMAPTPDQKISETFCGT